MRKWRKSLREPGVADAALDQNTTQFLDNLYRKNIPPMQPEPGMMMINVALAETSVGDPSLSDEELAVYVTAFEATGFSGSINWYRNMDRNWEILADVDPIIRQPALMIYGERNMIPQSENMTNFVPNMDVISPDCGHWVQQEMSDETSNTILAWLAAQSASVPVD